MFFLTISSKADKNKMPEPRGYGAGEISKMELHASGDITKTLKARSEFVYSGLACQAAKIYDACRSCLNVFDDKLREYLQMNSVTCILIFENSIVDRTENLFGDPRCRFNMAALGKSVKLANFNKVYS